MRTRKLLLFSAALFLAVVSCKKDTEVNKDTFKIENEKVEASTQSVKITGTYAYLGAIDGITLELGRQADLMDGDAYRTLLEGTDFSVEVKNLRTNTTYYYRYSVDYGGKAPYRTEIKTFKTEEYNLPEVKSKEVVSVGVNRAEVSGEVLSDGGGDAVTLRGICWSMSHNPSVGDEYANAGEGIGTFTCELTNLQPEKTYYARAFAGNSKGVSYGEELTFLTLAAGSLAEVKTIGITGNANLQATVSGEVTMEGTSAVLERGVCYGKEHYPTTSGLHVSTGSGTGEFSCQLTNLEAGATYYVRAYAINGLGVSYGEEMSFEAQTETTTPVVITQMVSGITQTSATGHGTVVSDGGATVTRRGLCWSTEHNPTADVTHADCGSGVGEFSGLMPHLEDMTTYYVRAYAENSVGMAYGEEVSFTVGDHFHPVLPSIGQFTITGTIVTYSIIDDGGAEVIEHGTCWGTANGPTVSDNHVSGGSGTGEFSIELTDLLPGTTYYVRIYAINSVGVAYSEELSFTTDPAVTVPTVTTSQVMNITQTTATGGGNVTDDGNATVTERGICWNTSHNPTIYNSNASGGMGMGDFIAEMTELIPNTTYYMRAYAKNSVGTAYGEEISFLTLSYEPIPFVFENGFVTDPGAMANGADASWIKGAQSTWGPNVNNASGYWLADSFTLSSATSISEIEVYGYQTGSSTTSTFTGLYAQIYNGNPMNGASVVWGSATSNIMTATAFTNCYRGSDGETNSTTRPIMSITASNLDIQLEAGTYYLAYGLTGSGTSGPWGTPRCEPSIGNTGAGVQNTGNEWQDLIDTGASTTYGCSMKLSGVTYPRTKIPSLLQPQLKKSSTYMLNKRPQGALKKPYEQKKASNSENDCLYRKQDADLKHIK